MKKNISDYIVAVVVIACSAILFGALTIALSGWHGGAHKRTQEIDFPDVTGIHMRSEVRYAGAPAGSVIAMRLLSIEERRDAAGHQRENAVRITVELRPDVPKLSEDVHASLGSDTLLSDKFVALSAGSPDAPALASGVALQGRSSGGLEKLADSIGPLADSLEPLLKRVDSVLQSIEPVLKKTGEAVETLKDGMGDALPRISKLADGLKGTSDAAEAALKRIDRLIAEVDEPVKSDLKEIKGVLVQLEQALGEADHFITRTDKNLSPRLQELAVILENLKVVSTHAKALTQALAEKPNRLIFSGKPKKLTSEEEILRSDKPLPALAPESTPGAVAEKKSRPAQSGGER
jgi:ABC-type transporter Mla subunit MlaD